MTGTGLGFVLVEQVVPDGLPVLLTTEIHGSTEEVGHEQARQQMASDAVNARRGRYRYVIAELVEVEAG